MPQVVQRGRDLNRIPNRRDVAPHEHPRADVPGKILGLVERHRLVAATHSRVVYPERIRQSNIRPAPESLREQQLTLVAADECRRGTAPMPERHHDKQRRVERASPELG